MRLFSGRPSRLAETRDNEEHLYLTQRNLLEKAAKLFVVSVQDMPIDKDIEFRLGSWQLGNGCFHALQRQLRTSEENHGPDCFTG